MFSSGKVWKTTLLLTIKGQLKLQYISITLYFPELFGEPIITEKNWWELNVNNNNNMTKICIHCVSCARERNFLKARSMTSPGGLIALVYSTSIIFWIREKFWGKQTIQHKKIIIAGTQQIYYSCYKCPNYNYKGFSRDTKREVEE